MHWELNSIWNSEIYQVLSLSRHHKLKLTTEILNHGFNKEKGLILRNKLQMITSHITLQGLQYMDYRLNYKLYKNYMHCSTFVYYTKELGQNLKFMVAKYQVLALLQNSKLLSLCHFNEAFVIEPVRSQFSKTLLGVDVQLDLQTTQS